MSDDEQPSQDRKALKKEKAVKAEKKRKRGHEEEEEQSDKKAKKAGGAGTRARRQDSNEEPRGSAEDHERKGDAEMVNELLAALHEKSPTLVCVLHQAHGDADRPASEMRLRPGMHPCFLVLRVCYACLVQVVLCVSA